MYGIELRTFETLMNFLTTKLRQDKDINNKKHQRLFLITNIILLEIENISLK